MSPSRTALPEASTSAPDLSQRRRRNVLALFQQHAEASLARGESPKGMDQRFAATLQISPSMWSQLKSSRAMGDKLARQIECLAGKPAGWLDEAQETSTPTPAERSFLEVALALYRASGARGRRELRHELQQRLDAAGELSAAGSSSARPPAPR